MTLTLHNPFSALHEDNEDRPVGLGYGARVGTTWVRLAANPGTPLRYYTRDSLAQRQAQASNVYEAVLDIGYSFQRQDLTGGEGLDFFPRTFGRSQQELDETRFFDSESIDIQRPARGDSFSLKLHKAAETWYTPTNAPVDIAASAERLFVAEGLQVHEFNNWTHKTPDNSQTLGSENIEMIDIDGAGNGIALLTNGDLYWKPAASSQWTVVTPTTVLTNIKAVWFVKDRIMAYRTDPTASAEPAELGEINLAVAGTVASPTFSPTFVLVDTFYARPVDVIDAGTVILVATDDGYLRSYRYETDKAGGTPALTIKAKSPVPVGEYPFAVGYNGGTLLILTVELENDNQSPVTRLYAAEVLDQRFDFIVGQLDFLREWTGVLAPSFTDRFVSSRNYLFWTVREEDGDSYLWRYDLRTTGVVRQTKLASGETAKRIIVWRERLAWFTATTLNRIGDEYVQEGWLITPNINFGLNTDINWIAASLQTAEVQDRQGAQIELYISTDVEAITDKDHPSWRLAIRLSNTAEDEIELSLSKIVGRTAALQLRMFNNQSSLGTPEVLRFGLRGLPKHRDWIVELPVNVSDMIEVPGRMPYRLDGWGDVIHNTMLDYQGEHLTLQVMDPPMSFSGIVDNIVEPIEYIGERGAAGKVCVLQFRGTRLIGGTFGVAETNPTGDSGTGLGLIGVATLGIGQTGTT